MKHVTLLGQLLPPVSYQPTEQNLHIQLTAEGKQHDLLHEFTKNILNAFTPATSGEFISLWEYELGLDGTGLTYQQRVAAVLAKLNETGGLSIPYFINLAQKAGYSIKIVEPTPFRTGVSRCGEALYDEDVMYVWWVIVQGQTQTVWRFRTGMSTTGEHLSIYADTFIESLFQKLKPAHTTCVFFYEKDGNK